MKGLLDLTIGLVGFGLIVAAVSDIQFNLVMLQVLIGFVMVMIANIGIDGW